MGPFLRLILIVGLAFSLTIPLAHAQPVEPGGGRNSTTTSAEAQTFDLGTSEAFLSPDGEKIASLTADEETAELCVFRLADEEELCQEVDPKTEPRSLSWSPDSTWLAWSLQSLTYSWDSDIYLMDAASGELNNLTDDGENGRVRPPDDPTEIDTFPAWSPEGTELVFARTRLDQDETSLWTIPTGGGTPREVEGFRIGSSMAIDDPLFWRGTDTIFASTIYGEDNELGVWRIEGGNADLIVPGDGDANYPHPVLSTVNEDATLVFGYSSVYLGPQRMERSLSETVAFRLDVQEGEIQAAEDDLIDDRDNQHLGAMLRLSPDGQHIVYIVAGTFSEEYTVVVAPVDGDAEPRVVSDVLTDPIAETTVMRGLEWAANDTVLIPLVSGEANLIPVLSNP